MPRLFWIAALAPALLGPLAPSTAVADPNPDCVVLRQAAGDYSKLASHFSSLRKVAEQSSGTPDQHADIKRQLAQQARTMGETLRDLAGKLTSQDLKNLYWSDAESFDDYADAIISGLNSGDNSAAREAYDRNLQAVNAANRAFHAQCK